MTVRTCCDTGCPSGLTPWADFRSSWPPWDFRSAWAPRCCFLTLAFCLGLFRCLCLTLGPMWEGIPRGCFLSSSISSRLSTVTVDSTDGWCNVSALRFRDCFLTSLYRPEPARPLFFCSISCLACMSTTNSKRGDRVINHTNCRWKFYVPLWTCIFQQIFFSDFFSD